MVAKTPVLTAAQTIDKALKEFVCNRAEAKVLVEVNELGHLWAVVASDGFENLSKEELRDRIWEHLRQTVPPDQLGYLYRLYALTGNEYDSRVTRSAFPGGQSEALELDPDSMIEPND